MNKTISRTLSMIMALALTLGTFITGQAKSNTSDSLTNNVSKLNPALALPAFAAEADARVHEANPATNYGTYGTVLYVEGGSDPDIESYLRFTVSGIGGAVTSAKLRVYITDGATSGPALYMTSNSWTETGITWNNRPGRTSGALEDKGALGANTWAEYDVTSQVTGNGTYSFVLATDSTDSLALSSREGSSGPQLVVTVADTAAPTSTPTTPPTATPTTVPPTATPTTILPTNTPTPDIKSNNSNNNPTPTPTTVAPTATPVVILPSATAIPATATATPATVLPSPTPTTVLPSPTPTTVRPTATPTTVVVPPTATPTTQVVVSSPPSSGSGMWISSSEIMSLPTSGTAWDRMRTTAYGSWGAADLKNQDNKHSIYTLAGALVYARTGDTAMRSKVRDAILSAKRTMDESGEWQTTNGVLAAGRQIGAYVISADLIALKSFDAAADNEFRSWLAPIRTTAIGTHSRWKTITYTCENAAANWSAFACASRIAASIYLGDTADVQRSASIMRALFGERSSYPTNAPGQNGYFQHTAEYQTSWSCNESTWTGINPNCSKSGVNLDGAPVEDASRGGGCCVLQGAGISYPWEALQGWFVSAELLYRAGSYGNPYTWSNNALKRTMDFMQRNSWGITGPATYVPWMANARYGTSYPTTSSSSGRIMSWGDWLYKR